MNSKKQKPAAEPAAKVSKSEDQLARRLEKFESVFEQIYKLVLRIPPGRVMTYGQIARLLDDRYSPRLVGWAMHATPKDERNIPWHRVFNSRGATSTGRPERSSTLWITWSVTSSAQGLAVPVA